MRMEGRLQARNRQLICESQKVCPSCLGVSVLFGMLDSWSFFSPQTDISELNLPKTCVTDFPDPDDLLNFKLYITPDEVCFFKHHGRLCLTNNFCFDLSSLDLPGLLQGREVCL